MKTGSALLQDIDACRPGQGKLAFWWLGQLGYAIKCGDAVLYLDAYLSPDPKRNVPPLLAPEEVTNAALFFGTHDHMDHIDRAVWKRLSVASPNARFVVPLLLRQRLAQELDIPIDRFVGLSDGMSETIQGVKVTAIPASHEFLDRDPETGLYPYLGYIIEADGRRIYHSGDTCLYEGLVPKLNAFGRFDAMFLPINGRDAKRYRSNIIGNMTYQEAVDLAGTLKPGLVVPGHYEMFDNNREDRNLFAEYLQAKYPGQKCWIGEHGDPVII